MQSTLASGSSKSTHAPFTRIQHPGWAWVGRVAWLVVLLGTLWLLANNLSHFYAFGQVVCEQNCHPFALTSLLAKQLAEFGLPLSFWPAHIIAFDILTSVLYIGVGTLIFLRRSDDWLSLITSSMLLMLGINVLISNSTFPDDASTLHLRLAQLHTVVAIYLVVKFASVFPNGRYVRRIDRFVVYGLVAWEVLRRVFLSDSMTDSGASLLMYVLIIIGFVTWLMLGQIYRYRHMSTPGQRQQTKWVMLASALTLVGMVTAASTYFIVLPLFDPQVNTLPLNVALRALYYLALMALPVGIGFSVFRYKIWEADLAINRSIVYGCVALIIIAGFALGFVLLDRALWLLAGQDLQVVASVLTTLGVVVSFRPIMSRVRHLIDTHIYHFRTDLGELAQRQRRAEAVILRGETGALTGQQRDSYLLQAMVGKGGMGQVYHAIDARTDQAVAVKVLSDLLLYDSESVARFQREAQMARDLEHPRLVHVLDFGGLPDQPYLVMPFVDGLNMSQHLEQNGPFALDALMPILADVVEGLTYLHMRGLVHRDVKPSNVILAGDGRAYLTDFGLMKLLDDATMLTASGLIGTLDYIAPEQISDASSVDHRCDIYALGVMTYQALTGVLPFKGSVGQLVFAHLKQPPPDPRTVMPDLPAWVAQAVMRALAKNPQDRYESVAAFLHALQQQPVLQPAPA